MTQLNPEFIAQAVKTIQQVYGNQSIPLQEIQNLAIFFITVAKKIEQKLETLDPQSKYAKKENDRNENIVLKKSIYAANLYGKLMNSLSKMPKETQKFIKIPYLKNLTKAYLNNSGLASDNWSIDTLTAALEKGLQTAPVVPLEKAMASDIQQVPVNITQPIIKAAIHTAILELMNGDSSKTVLGNLTGLLLEKYTENYPFVRNLLVPAANLQIDQAIRHYLPDVPKVYYAPLVTTAFSVGLPLLWSYREKISTELKNITAAFNEASQDYCDAFCPPDP